jgi:exodeoxyribonuclease-3
MKIATWNVNGIRARAVQLHEWLERDRPDVVCLQELKAELAQLPEVVQRQDYHGFWHCCKGYSGVSLQLRKDVFPAEPAYRHPPFDRESRVVTAELDDLVIASMYVPNGGRDYAEPPRPEHRLAAGLPARVTRRVLPGPELRSAGRGGDQRPRAGGDDHGMNQASL